MCSLASLGWGQCNLMASLHPPCHSQALSVTPFLFLAHLWSLFIIPRSCFYVCLLFHTSTFFSYVWNLLFDYKTQQDPWQICSPWIIFSVCPLVQVKTSDCSFLPVSSFCHGLSWFVFFSGRVFSENLCLKLKNKWSWGKNIVLEGINSWGEDIVLEGINSTHHLVPTSLAQGL